jgi:hypothetical protein
MSTATASFFAACAALALAGTARAEDTAHPTSGAIGWSMETLAVNASDGIDAVEGERIARAYFERHVGCGGFTAIVDGGHVWIVEGRRGFAGTRIEGFTIDKHDGAIASPIGPSYADPHMRVERPPVVRSPLREQLLRSPLDP